MVIKYYCTDVVLERRVNLQLVLYDLRKNQKKMTQEQMARYLGITPKTYRSKELGNTEFTLDEMFEIAKLFNKKIDDIFLPRRYQNGTEGGNHGKDSIFHSGGNRHADCADE